MIKLIECFVVLIECVFGIIGAFFKFIGAVIVDQPVGVFMIVVWGLYKLYKIFKNS